MLYWRDLVISGCAFMGFHSILTTHSFPSWVTLSVELTSSAAVQSSLRRVKSTFGLKKVVKKKLKRRGDDVFNDDDDDAKDEEEEAKKKKIKIDSNDGAVQKLVLCLFLFFSVCLSVSVCE